MAQLTWSPQAIADLRGIYHYIARDSEHYAKLFTERIIAIVESIPTFPQLGPKVPEYQLDELRERRCQNYRIVYRVKSDNIEVVTICHGARLLPPIE